MSHGDGLTRLTEALEARGRRIEQNGRQAQCPGPKHANGDQNPSLSIGQGRDGAVLNCRVGCSFDEVLEALGMSAADLFDEPPERRQQGEWTPFGDAVAVYDYTDEHGQLLFQVCRVIDAAGKKQFPQRRPDPTARSGWLWKLGSIRKPLYRLPRVIEAVKNGETIYAVEGEKDVHALERAGVVATTSPGGAGKWKPEYDDVLKGATVIVVADKDKPGRDHAKDIATHLTHKAASVRVVEAAEGNDTSDHLAAGHTLGDLVPYSWESVRSVSMSGVSDTSYSVSESPAAVVTSESDTSDTDTARDASLLAGARDGGWLGVQQFPPLRWAVPGLIPEGFTLLIGPPKIGKSWLLLSLLLGIASGGAALGAIGLGDPRPVFYLALEDSDRRMQDRCRTLLGDGQPIPPRFSYQTSVQPAQVLDTIAAWMRREPSTRLVVVDTLGRVMPPAWQGESAYQRDYRIGAQIKQLADATPGLSITISHHDRKASADDFIDSVSGTHGLAGAADTIAVLGRRRGGTEGLLKVTGRDVAENEYALVLDQGVAWRLDGASLDAAAAQAAQRASAMSLSDTSAQIIAFVGQHPEGVRAADVAAKFGKHAYTYLKRLAEDGRIDKAGRGYYTPLSQVSEVSETQVSGHTVSDSGSDSVRNGGWPDGSIGAEEHR